MWATPPIRNVTWMINRAHFQPPLNPLFHAWIHIIKIFIIEGGAGAPRAQKGSSQGAQTSLRMCRFYPRKWMNFDYNCLQGVAWQLHWREKCSQVFVINYYARFYCHKNTINKLTLSIKLVLGEKSPAELGVILPHEQPLVDLTGLFMEVPARYSGTRDPKDITNLDFRLENIAKIRRFPYNALVYLSECIV